MLFSNPWGQTADKIFRSEQIAQIDREVRAADRVVFPSDATMDVAKELVINRAVPCPVLFQNSPQSSYGKQRLEHIFKSRDSSPEFFEDLLSIPVLPFHALEHPSLNLLFARHWRKVREGEEVFALEVRALRHELFSALVINDSRYGIRKPVHLWVAGSLGTDAVALHHPSAS